MPRHSESRVLPYSADQMYDLVADVANYPKFLPWTAAARIRSREGGPEGEVMLADLVISFKVFREQFGSKVVLWPEEKRIETEYLDGPFRHLQSEWRFEPLSGGGCRVHFWVDFEFRNAIIGRVVGVVFNEAMQRVVAAFEKRAKALYGRPAA
ncbi:type II toxin-antitoxin system RatA family toxin [Jannaschia sp. 2305UL9-9]|uniref:type II toxin-antitoxin system RatA family toxin n=1 Tax=Jannaschia sp. 2305UL9-9 TaxID=3121638 RepID=UPI003528E802